MKKILKWLDVNLEPIMLATVFFAILILVVVQVILRFFFSAGYAWGEEVARYLFVWLCFLGISYASRNNKHMDVAYLRNVVPVPARKVIMITSDVLALILFGYLLSAAVATVKTTATYGDMAISIAISKNYVYASAVVGYFLAIIRTIQTMVWKIKRFGCTYELFTNSKGMYSGANNICFATQHYRDEMDAEIRPEVIAEELARKEGKK